MLASYYVFCVIYCFYQLNKKYKVKGIGYGVSPEMDAIMVLIMGWILAPVDVSITWINMVKKAEEAKRRQESLDLFKGDSKKERELIRDSIY
jgi:hypothetical protein